jgi:hypothetical protein
MGCVFDTQNVTGFGRRRFVIVSHALTEYRGPWTVCPSPATSSPPSHPSRVGVSEWSIQSSYRPRIATNLRRGKASGRTARDAAGTWRRAESTLRRFDRHNSERRNLQLFGIENPERDLSCRGSSIE